MLGKVQLAVWLAKQLSNKSQNKCLISGVAQLTYLPQTTPWWRQKLTSNQTITMDVTSGLVCVNLPWQLRWMVLPFTVVAVSMVEPSLSSLTTFFQRFVWLLSKNCQQSMSWHTIQLQSVKMAQPTNQSSNWQVFVPCQTSMWFVPQMETRSMLPGNVLFVKPKDQLCLS